MTSACKNLDALQQSSRERLRVSIGVHSDLQKCVRRTMDAISRTHFLIAQTNEMLERLPGAAQSSREATPPPQTRVEIHPDSGDLEIVSGQNFHGEIVRMDHKHFVDCNLIDCTLEYSGQPVVVETTRFSGCGFRFTGEAALTACFLDCFGLLKNGAGNYAMASTDPTRSTLIN